MSTSSFSRPRFRLYVERTFSQKFDATLAFVFENWRPMLKYITLLLLPVCIVQGFCLEELVSVIGNMSDNDVTDSTLVLMGANYLFTIIFYLGGSILFSAAVYTLMRIYLRRGERLRGIGWTQCKADLTYCLQREAQVVAVFIGIIIVVAVLYIGLIALAAVIDSVALLLVMFPIAIGLLVVLQPLMLAFPIVALTDMTLGQAFRKAWRLGLGTWGSMFAFLLVITLMVSILANMLSLPWTVCYMIRVLFLDTTASATMLSWAPVLSVLTYIFGVLMVYVNYLLYSVVMVGMAVLYGHASEKMEGTSVEHAIDEFEQSSPDGGDADVSKMDEIDEFENL